MPLLCLLAALILCGTAQASTTAPELNAVASSISGQQIEVRCWGDDQDPDYDSSSWGYVYLSVPIVFLDPTACAGAEGLVKGTFLPLWQLALGALVLTHESYHLKTILPEWRRGDEGQTECRAVKRVRQTMLDLGASVPLADEILPWALAIHYRITTFDGYEYPSCAVPIFKDFWP